MTCARGAEWVLDLVGGVASCQNGSRHGLLGTDQIREVATGDESLDEAPTPVEAGEALVKAHNIPMLGQHERQQRRTATTGADDEPFHRGSASVAPSNGEASLL